MAILEWEHKNELTEFASKFMIKQYSLIYVYEVHFLKSL